MRCAYVPHLCYMMNTKYVSKLPAGGTSYWQGVTQAALLHSGQQRLPCVICLYFVVRLSSPKLDALQQLSTESAALQL